ncbi:MAG: SH3 domain-containing protein [Chloroflexi bacterium]|nr:MAG: SH3 domain-containing protein [Chloroflexota bacterium]
MNVRQGPGTNYPVLGQLPPGQSLPVVGQNESGTWWQVPLPNGGRGWIADSVVQVSGPVDVPVVPAPPPPAPPTATLPPPEPPKPQFQYEPTGWYADTNYGLTRFLGTITDAGGAPVNGVSVEARCGDFSVISNPSGPVGWPPFYDSSGDPPGFWDLTLDTKPIPCKWVLTVVESPDGKTVTARMSDAIEVEVTTEESIITANWRKNW